MMSNATKTLVIFLTAMLLACGSQKNKNEAEEKPVVTVSILPVKTFVEEIAGNDFEINVLLPPGASPADFTLIPSQLKDIARSEVWFRIGYIGFEFSWKEKIEQANRNMKVVNLSEGLDLITDEYLPSGKKSSTGGINPHTWLSPTLVNQMAGHITEELVLLNPEKKEEYQENLSRFVQKVEALDAELRDKLANFEGRQIILFHPSLSYFAREYGLIQYSLEPGGKEPTPQRMAALVDFAKKEDIGVIYIQSDLDRSQARVFAEEIDGEIEEMWPLNPKWFDNLREITGLLIKHF
ncbi:zinc transport system substrate-binding protein [Tangfeifania diversioriginum]|uniref:Zinc transport system substrate-binding protein n=1 Tax=Tangfeifania diversioriginum TaxID=1168035 RepID=A0A1M6L5T1_9BACT|nr:zinc ABC transporter substrate-binding protein [Tangfeifania diversioriginum]SHJ66409.1 zinc transport system substrate-binding protein [Tangfeifania diversioriginum]